MFASRCNRTLRHAALASALFLALGTAVQASPGAHGHPGGPGGRGAHVEQVIAQLKAQLNLDSSQQGVFDTALAAAKSAREAGRAERGKIRAAMQEELAKPAPDLRRVATLADQVHTSQQTLHRQVRDQWLGLYETFSPAQKLVVRDALAQRAERMENFRGKMRERFGG